MILFKGDILKKKTLSSFAIIIGIIIIISLIFIISFEEISFKCGQKYYKKTDFQKAAFCYNLALKYNKLIQKTIIFNNKKLDKKIENLYLKIADSYTESGDIKKSTDFYNELLLIYKNKNIENEDFINYLEMETAENYIKLGYFDKALKIYGKIQEWYPQNLIKIYLDMKKYDKAKEILFSEQIQETIQNGDDIDSAVLKYMLLKYFKEIKEYNQVLELSKNDDLDIESKLFIKLILAEIYETIGENQKAYKLYEDLLISPYLKNSSDFILKLHYAILASKTGKTEEAKELYKEIEKSQKKLYKYSPQKICLQYYGAEIFPSKKQSMQKNAVNLFKKLQLGKESYFYNNISDFCKVNTEI